jgi:hypothetical protein
MISTKMSKEEAKEYASPSVSDAPMYSYGTCLCLDDDLLQKLGFTDPPPVGTEMMLVAKVVVTSSSSSQRQNGEKEARSDLQITDMELKAGGGKDAASRLYG